MVTYPLSAPNLAKGIPQLKKIGIFNHIFPLTIVFLYAVKRINLTGCILFSVIFLYIAWVPLGLALRYERIATSKVEFHDTFLLVKDKKGKIWRSMHYCNVTRVQVIRIPGFMSGYHGVNGIAPYIVLSTEHCNSLPNGSFYKKFTSEQIVPIFYNKKILRTIAERIPRLSLQCDRDLP